MSNQVYDQPQSYMGQPKRKSNRVLWIILLAIALILFMCCCVLTIVVIGSAVWFGVIEQADYYFFLPSLVGLI